MMNLKKQLKNWINELTKKIDIIGKTILGEIEENQTEQNKLKIINKYYTKIEELLTNEEFGTPKLKKDLKKIKSIKFPDKFVNNFPMFFIT